MRLRLHDALSEVRDILRGNEEHAGLYERVNQALYEVRGYKASMTLNDYQLRASATAVYPGRGSFVGLMYVTGKMAGEAGEFSENTFKALRDDNISTFVGTETDVIDNGVNDEGFLIRKPGDHYDVFKFGQLSPTRREKQKKELGDILWYVSQAAYELGYTLQEVSTDNLIKLAGRAERGVLKGSGSDR